MKNWWKKWWTPEEKLAAIKRFQAFSAGWCFWMAASTSAQIFIIPGVMFAIYALEERKEK